MPSSIEAQFSSTHASGRRTPVLHTSFAHLLHIQLLNKMVRMIQGAMCSLAASGFLLGGHGHGLGHGEFAHTEMGAHTLVHVSGGK